MTTFPKSPRQGTAPSDMAKLKWGSDVVVDMLNALGIEFISLNPGASFRGLHDSLVNYGAGSPGIVLCNHEAVAVGVAHGYAKAAGRPMAVALHTNVGLLNGSMAIFNAFLDRQPMVILGGTGPLDSTVRRPGVDWEHTSSWLGGAVRDFVKWEQQPFSVAAIPEVMLRAWQVAVTEPGGPVFLTLDARLQEQPLESAPRIPDIKDYRPPQPATASAEAVADAAGRLCAARCPVILLGDCGRHPEVWATLVELAELMGAAVAQDKDCYTIFPTNHYLQQHGFGSTNRQEMNEVLRQADVVLAMGRGPFAGRLRQAATKANSHFENLESQAVDFPAVILASVDHFAIRSWATDFQEVPPAVVNMTTTAPGFLEALLEAVRRCLRDDPSLEQAARARADTYRKRRHVLEERWERHRRQSWKRSPLSVERVLGEIRSALGSDYDESVVTRVPNVWPNSSWDFVRPGSNLGKDGGGGLGSAMAMAVGAALGLPSGHGPVVAFLGDGDALYAPQALWTVAHCGVPVMFVILNNRSYGNDIRHQEVVAIRRARPVENAAIGMDMGNPAVDFAGLSRSLGVEGFGPIETPEQLANSARAAISALKSGRPVLLDVVIGGV